MKVALLSTQDIDGGAARATYRLHQGLQALGIDSSLITRRKRSQDPTVYATDAAYAEHYVQRMGLAAVQSVFIDQNRSDRSNTLFSLPYPGVDLSQFAPVAEADVIHLHWVSKFQSITTLERLLRLGKPVVWTLHDCSAFTGGCHYPAGCDRYQHTCRGCPQLLENPFELPAQVLQDKLERLTSPMTVVTPSLWLADCARQSALFQTQPIQVIPYGLETEIFCPQPKAEAKQALGLEPGAIVLLIGANDGNESRKGFLPLFKALQLCCAHDAFQRQVTSGQITLLCFGTPSDLLRTLPIPVHSFGSVDSDATLSQIYAAADLFLLPSLEDNLPNTMLEAMSCGTPVVAFATGGIPDAVHEAQTGMLVPVGDLEALAAAILALVFDPEQRQFLGQQARQWVEAEYGLLQQAQHYAALYTALPKASPELTAAIAEGPPHLDTSMGSYFAAIYPTVAQEALLRERRLAEKRLARIQQRWQDSQEKLQYAKARLHETRLSLHHTQAELARSQDKIAEMERSKFWKMRQAWIRLKRLFQNPKA